MQESEENYLECGNFPDPSGEFQERVETEFGDGQAPSPSSEMRLWDPQDSDCLPSVFLAVVLALVFILVSWLFLSYDQGSRGLLHDCRAWRRANESCPLVTRLRSFRLLFPNQLETTWRILQQHVSSQQHRRHSDGTWILAAVGQGDVSNTLLCFLKAILLLVTEEHAIGVRFPEQNSAWLPWMGFLGNGTSAVATTEIYMGQSRVPYGVMVSFRRLTSGNQLGTKISLALALNVTEQAREEFLLQGLTLAPVSDILSAVCFASSRMPDKLITTQRNVPLLLVRPEWYLEGDFFC